MVFFSAQVSKNAPAKLRIRSATDSHPPKGYLPCKGGVKNSFPYGESVWARKGTFSPLVLPHYQNTADRIAEVSPFYSADLDEQTLKFSGGDRQY
jgi:hypothetical protein